MGIEINTVEDDWGFNFSVTTRLSLTSPEACGGIPQV